LNSPFSPQKRKIGPVAGQGPNTATAPSTEPTEKTKSELLQAGYALPDQTVMRHYRLDRILNQLEDRNLAGILLFDPINIRYALDARNMSIWSSRNLARAAFVGADGHTVLWDFDRCEHLTAHLPLINEVRSDAGAYYFAHGDKESQSAANFARQILDLLSAHGAGSLAVDRLDLEVTHALESQGIKLTTGQSVMEHARLIKGPNEIKAMKCAAFACMETLKEMEAATKPGMSEVEIWSFLHGGNIARGGEWVETRLLASGPRTNPWMAEAGPRIMEDGDLLAFDTDMIGLYGYICDMSRTWLVGDGAAAKEQIELYKVAHEHIVQNTQMMKPGVSFRELSFGGHAVPEKYRAQQYCVKMHGAGMCDEFPSIYYPEQFIEGAFDYDLKPGMVFSVEVYIGAVGGHEGVKLEDEVLITETDHEVITPYPYDARLLGQA